MEAMIGFAGILTGAILQYYFNKKFLYVDRELQAKSNLYTKLFSRLRNLNNEVVQIHDLICDAQVYASDEVLDILEKVQPGESFSEKVIHDLLVAIRQELRPKSKKRTLRVFIHGSNKA